MNCARQLENVTDTNILTHTFNLPKQSTVTIILRIQEENEKGNEKTRQQEKDLSKAAARA